jgi:hypothetical protein
MRPNRENLESRRCGDRRSYPGWYGDCRQSRAGRQQPVVDSWGDGHLHERLLLPTADALPGVPALRRHLRALLLQTDAVPDVPAL